MRRLSVFLLILISTLAQAADGKNFLPKVFAGWQLQSIQQATDPAKADPVYAGLLKEYGFNELETAQYSKPGRTMSVKLARFSDPSGAFGAYTIYRVPEMVAEEIGDQSASSNQRVLFRRGNMLLDVKLDRITPMSAGELRELASLLPVSIGDNAKIPAFIDDLPKPGMVPNSTKFVAGPVGLGLIGSALPPDQIDFSTGAEVATAQYKSGEGIANLYLLSYPTPAVAGIRLRSVQQWHPAIAPGSPAAPAVYSKRTGPVVVVITGSISDDEARTLLASVNYDADVTWNENTYFDKKNNLGSLLYNIIILTVIIIGFALVAGLAFGGLRVLLQKLFPDRAIGRSAEADFIRLNIGK